MTECKDTRRGRPKKKLGKGVRLLYVRNLSERAWTLAHMGAARRNCTLSEWLGDAIEMLAQNEGFANTM